MTIAKKLATMLAASTDRDLLDFARENIGLGVTQSRHMAVLKDLRVLCTVRKSRLGPKTTTLSASAGSKPVRSLSTDELVEAAGSERGPRLKQVLTELEQRRGDSVIAALGSAASSYEKEIQQLARDLLVRHLFRESAAVVKAKLKDDRAEVRAAAARVAGNKGLRLGDELIDLLDDPEAGVRQAARQALVRLSRSVDFGPEPNATEAQRAAAVRQWRAWWAKQGGR